MVKKDWRRVDLHIALCYPQRYRVGMTGLTVQLLYAMFNAREDTLCERVFMKTGGSPALSVESHQPLSRFDVVAFSLQYEIDYVNVLTMLREADISLRRDRHGSTRPILLAGGPAATANPTVLSEFFDIFIIGDWEPISSRVVGCLKEAVMGRGGFDSLDRLDGVYLPSLDQSIVHRSWAEDLDSCPHPTAQIVPEAGVEDPRSPIFGRCFSLEAVRSCDRGCFFCLACWIGRPKRERSLQKIEEILSDARRYTPVKKVSLIGAGFSDHTELEEVLSLVSSGGFSLSVPSLRPESIDREIASAIALGGQRSVSMAPEAGTPELRSRIGKNLTNELLLDASQTLYDAGIKRLKLYFMVGLPGEGEEDVDAIPDLAERILNIGFSRLVLSVNPFVPKPHTPFQREQFADLGYLRKSIRQIYSSTRSSRIRVEGSNPRNAQIQAVLSLGGPETGRIVELASLYGSTLGAWRRAFGEVEVSPREVLDSQRHQASPPWDFIDIQHT